jgi:hypothetical protein
MLYLKRLLTRGLPAEDVGSANVLASVNLGPGHSDVMHVSKGA